MEKVLKKYTTIPSHLYVNRSADLQLQRIIEEMQRPGYVLVARQMGKTNLLINAKRTLENVDRLFAYVDLSNLYQDDKNCYRNIINCIIEPNINHFPSIENQIEQIREKNLPPHNEYSRSLIAILNTFKGDLVIILDEIDALKTVSYSDNIFAQIRSNYFSRTNFPVLERLTYVLSGVIEPTELIKDKNKSPFNIGDKIYLDDFTKPEFQDFIEKSKLELRSEITEEIFYWTNGNPRLTFDICSEVETQIIETGSIEIADIGKIIGKKYLSSFDVAPIDHIRELVRSNRDIRKAVSHIKTKNVGEISDDVKRKLYLYGIIGSNFNDEIYIKNKIIEESLSFEWLRSIDKSVTLVSGLNVYSERNYVDAIEIFEQIFNTSTSKSDIETSAYFLGISYLKLGEYEKAIKSFTFSFIDETFKEDAKALLGVCQLASGDRPIAIATLEEAVKSETNRFAYHNALLTLALEIKDPEKSLSLLEQLFASTYKAEDSTENEISQLRALSLYHQAEIYIQRGELPLGIEKLARAIENSNIEFSIFLLFYKAVISDEVTETVKRELVTRIVDNKLKFETIDLQLISFTERHIYVYMDWIFDKSKLDLFEKLLAYTHENLLPGKSRYEIILDVIRRNGSNRKLILWYLLEFEENIEKPLLLNVYREIVLNENLSSSRYTELFSKYMGLFIELPREELTIEDIYIFAFEIKRNSDQRKLHEALALCDIINVKTPGIKDKELAYESLIIYYWYATLNFSLKNRDNAIKYSDMALTAIQESNGRKMSMIDETGIKSIESQLQKINYSSLNSLPIIAEKKYGRNEKVKVKYKDGEIIEKKYKQIEADLLSGRCEML